MNVDDDPKAAETAEWRYSFGKYGMYIFLSSVVSSVVVGEVAQRIINSFSDQSQNHIKLKDILVTSLKGGAILVLVKVVGAVGRFFWTSSSRVEKNTFQERLSITSLVLRALEPAQEIEENTRDQLKHLAASLGGKERRHAAVIAADPIELRQLAQQLPLLPEFQGWKCYYCLKEKFDFLTLYKLINFLYRNPKSILIDFPMAFFPKEIPFPRETVFIFNLPSKSAWNEVKHFSLLKGIQLPPLSYDECKTLLTQWISSFGKELEPHSLEAAIEMAFLSLAEEEKGRALSLAKDLIERASKIAGSSPISITHVWEVYKTLYPLLLPTPQAALLLKQPPLRSLNEIALILEDKFNICLIDSKESLMAPPLFLEDLNQKMKGEKQFAVGNERRIAELEKHLKGLDKNNAILVGSPGVGKTTLIESIAWMIENGQIKEDSPFYGKRIYSLDLNKMMVDTKWMGTTHERVRTLFEFLSQHKEAILFIDEIQQLLGAGTSENNEMGSIAQLMKQDLLKHNTMVIGATTTGEYKKWFQTDVMSAFRRRFREVNIEEPTLEESVLILNHIVESEPFKALFPGVQFERGSIERAVQMMKNTPSKVGNPDRTKDFIEKVAQTVSARDHKVVTIAVIEECFKLFYKISRG